MRLKWVKMYETTGSAGMTCLRCGISRPTLRKWWRRYQARGVDGLRSQSRTPKSSPARKAFRSKKEKILSLRSERRLGARRIQNELYRLHDIHPGLATIHKVLTRSGVAPLKRKRRVKEWKRYSCPIPGERVQMDTGKIASGLYQYTAIADCTRYMVVALYPRKTAENTLRFLIERLLAELPFPVQRIQTDRGGEFFSHRVQQAQMAARIKFRPVKPRSPHLNGKVERAQRTVLDEFYDGMDITQSNLEEELGRYQHYYNRERAHGAHNGKTPTERYLEVSHTIPSLEDVQAAYDPDRESIRSNRTFVWIPGR
jgi:transposase InsO family protein